MQEIVWLLQNGPGSADKREQSFEELFPYLELHDAGKTGYEIAESLPRPHLLKTHFHAKFFKRQLEGNSACPRIIVVLRNPKDLLVSFYHFHKMWKDYFPGDWEDFFEVVKNDKTIYGNYFEHAASWWKHRESPNVLMVRYEDMNREPKAIVQLVANFIGVNRSEEEVEAITSESSFASMKARGIEKYSTMMVRNFINDTDAQFFRAGKTGNWRELFDADKSAWVDGKASAAQKKYGLTFTESWKLHWWVNFL